MKTYPFEIGQSGSIAPHRISISGLLRIAISLVCATLVSFVAPSAMAGAADGDYAFVSASGSISAGGETLDLPQDILQEIGAIQDGKIVIKNNKIQLNRKAALRIIKDIGKEFGIEFETSISGPTSLKLRKSGKSYTGSTSEPVVVVFSAMFEGDEYSGNIKTDFVAKVKGNKLTLRVPITGKLLGNKFSGEMNIVCKR